MRATRRQEEHRPCKAESPLIARMAGSYSARFAAVARLRRCPICRRCAVAAMPEFATSADFRRRPRFDTGARDARCLR